MSGFAEFASTLESKIRRQLEEEILGELCAEPTPPFQVHDELPLGYAWLLAQNGSAQKQSTPLQRARSAYGVKARPTPPHILNVEQTLAFETFHSLGAALSPAFKEAELKSAWRIAARSTHPDFGGQSLAFQAVQSAYLVLQTLFKKK